MLVFLFKILRRYCLPCNPPKAATDGKEGRELGLPGLLYADDLVLCGESEEDLGAMVGSLVGV